MSTFTATLQSFFTTYLVGQRAASPHTISAYRDTFKMLLTHLHDTVGITADAVEFTDVNAETITAFLAHLETVRKNTVRTRNARLSALHAFFAYAAYLNPEHADLIARALAIKSKRTATTVLTYLSDAEVDALLAAPDQTTKTGLRDHTIILVMVTTGLRISELTALTRKDLHLGRPSYLLCHGKGRKDRITPLNKETSEKLSQWVDRSPGLGPESPVFTPQGNAHPISRDAVAARLRVHAATAAKACPTIVGKTITPHTLRHTTAMRMLNAGIGITTIALWLGHESTQATQAYLHADLRMKEHALTRLTPIGSGSKRYSPRDELLTFLEGL